MKILRPKDLAEKLGISRMQLHRWSTHPEYAHLNFPKPFPLGPASVGYYESEIDDWLQTRADERGGEAA